MDIFEQDDQLEQDICVDAEQEETPQEEMTLEACEEFQEEVAAEEQPQLTFVAQPDESEAEPAQPEKKKLLTPILLGVLIVAIVFQIFALLAISKATTGIAGTTINEKGELIIYYTNGTSQNMGVVVGKSGTNGTTTIVTDGADNSRAISQALRSSVSIVCTFIQRKDSQISICR